MLSKCVKQYVNCMTSDERFVTKDGDNYINSWIRLSELTGKVGEVEAEVGEAFPMTMAQKQALLLKLIGLNNEMINSAVFDVENRRLLGDSLGFPEFRIPQESQRGKQVREISAMVKSGITVPIEPDIDDDQVHIEVCKDFLSDVEGFELKMTNPQAYQVILSHLQMHNQNMQQNADAMAIKQANLKAQGMGETITKPPLEGASPPPNGLPSPQQGVQ